jgi:hypothetical protein
MALLWEAITGLTEEGTAQIAGIGLNWFNNIF